MASMARPARMVRPLKRPLLVDQFTVGTTPAQAPTRVDIGRSTGQGVGPHTAAISADGPTRRPGEPRRGRVPPRRLPLVLITRTTAQPTWAVALAVDGLEPDELPGPPQTHPETSFEIFYRSLVSCPSK